MIWALHSNVLCAKCLFLDRRYNLIKTDRFFLLKISYLLLNRKGQLDHRTYQSMCVEILNGRRSFNVWGWNYSTYSRHRHKQWSFFFRIRRHSHTSYQGGCHNFALNAPCGVILFTITANWGFSGSFNFTSYIYWRVDIVFIRIKSFFIPANFVHENLKHISIHIWRIFLTERKEFILFFAAFFSSLKLNLGIVLLESILLMLESLRWNGCAFFLRLNAFKLQYTTNNFPNYKRRLFRQSVISLKIKKKLAIAPNVPYSTVLLSFRNVAMWFLF